MSANKTIEYDVHFVCNRGDGETKLIISRCEGTLVVNAKDIKEAYDLSMNALAAFGGTIHISAVRETGRGVWGAF